MEQFGGPCGFRPAAGTLPPTPSDKYSSKQPTVAYPNDGGRHSTNENQRPADGQTPRQSSSVPSMASNPVHDPPAHSAQPSSYYRAPVPRSASSGALDEEARLSQYEVIRQIGAGRFGEVFIIRHKATKALLCWKLVFYKGLREKEKKQLVSEVNVMRELRHANIVRYHDRIVCRSRQCLYIVMEYCDAGDLAKQIEAAHKHHGGIDQDRIVLVVVQLIHALAYCHEGVGQERRRVLHRDLKPCNIFLASHPEYPDDPSRCIAKLGDFGLSRHLNMHSMAHSCVGTPYYWSPELLEDGQKTYNVKSDMWALGCVIYEMCTGKTPFAQAQTMPQLKERVRCGPVLPIPGFSDSLNALMASLLQPNPNNRPSALQCLGYTLFRGCSYTPPPLYRPSSSASRTPRDTSPARGSPSGLSAAPGSMTSKISSSLCAPSSRRDSPGCTPTSVSSTSRYPYRSSSTCASPSPQQAPGRARQAELPREGFDPCARPGFFAEAPPPHAFGEAPPASQSAYLPPSSAGAKNEEREKSRDRTRRAAVAPAATVAAFERQRDGRSLSPDPSAPLASIEEEEEGEGDDGVCSVGSGTGTTRRIQAAPLGGEDRRGALLGAQADGVAGRSQDRSRPADSQRKDDRDSGVWTGARRTVELCARPESDFSRDHGALSQAKSDNRRFSVGGPAKRTGAPQTEDRSQFSSDTSLPPAPFPAGLSRRCSEPPAAFHAATSPWDAALQRPSSAAPSSSSSRSVSPSSSSLLRLSSRERKHSGTEDRTSAPSPSGAANIRAERGPDADARAGGAGGAAWTASEETRAVQTHARHAVAQSASSFFSEGSARATRQDEGRDSEPHLLQGRGGCSAAGEHNPAGAPSAGTARDSAFERGGRRDGRTDGGDTNGFGFWANGGSDEQRDRVGADTPVSPFSSAKSLTRRSSAVAGLPSFASPNASVSFSARAPAEWRRADLGSTSGSASPAGARDYLPSPRSWQSHEKSFPSSAPTVYASPAYPSLQAPYPEAGPPGGQCPRRRQSAFPSVKRLEYEEEHASSSGLPTLLSPRFPHPTDSRPAGGVSPRSAQTQALVPPLAAAAAGSSPHERGREGSNFDRRIPGAEPLSSGPFSLPQERETRWSGDHHALGGDTERAETRFSHAFRTDGQGPPFGAFHTAPRGDIAGVSEPGARASGPFDHGQLGSGAPEGQAFGFTPPTHAPSEKKDAESEWNNPTATVFYSPRSPRSDLARDGARAPRNPYGAHFRPGLSQGCPFSGLPAERYEDKQQAGPGGAFFSPTFGSQPRPQASAPPVHEHTFGRNPSFNSCAFSANAGLRRPPATAGMSGDTGAFHPTVSLPRASMSRRVSAPVGGGSVEAPAGRSRYGASSLGGLSAGPFPQTHHVGEPEGTAGGGFGRRQDGDASRVDAQGAVSPRSFSLQRTDAPFPRGQSEGSRFQHPAGTRPADLTRKGEKAQTAYSFGKDFSHPAPEGAGFDLGDPMRQTRAGFPSPRGTERRGLPAPLGGRDTAFPLYSPRVGHSESEPGCSPFEEPSDSLRRDGEDRENIVPKANGHVPVCGVPASKHAFGEDCVFEKDAWTGQKLAPENFHSPASVAPYPSSLLTGFAEGQKMASRSSCLGGERERLVGHERSLRSPDFPSSLEKRG
ncbi:mgc81305 protein, related [Neospora caninum Liverpool]|uniref:non-specific serine/threonine protein kinase n=1 Tax=Neospora caninum (strain Liverpool) TaxID=572307 RepID=F0VCE4_NEOCL|nr:mgc81305 protein, related [Neospora caninum Liverpool]CBZ51266.1 mgc81305 protein, related [Neospora caninum Liverpool]CEL68581.1 TPA: MGC81305 protein, related [Neospora caninum Liverpool]|eukprot:XP_003881299.1 mgc81305 protein, related [Neospora caninum Liverpool]